MSKTVVGIFQDARVAEEAVSDLRKSGFDKEISILAKEEQQSEGQQREERDLSEATFETSDSIADGTTTGGVLGGLAGLAAGAGALAIPGIGPIIAAGPISGVLSGALTGGVAGGLLDWGIPEDEGRKIEEDVKQGKIVVAINTSEGKVDKAQDILGNHGAENVKAHDQQR
ncbi:MAG: DUF1269 domain-containing protein [Clostridia bacterium]|nr:DUF1269 domain-containing protein [Clostridia bacterium]